MATTPTAMEYDPFSPDFQSNDPFAVYRWMRDEAPVYYSEKWNWWALSRFDDVRAAALDPDTFRSFEGIDIDDTAKDQSGPGFLPDIDNPRHDQVRAVVQPFFLPRRIATQEDSIRATVRQLIGRWRERGSVDLAEELSWPMPNAVFFDLLGLPTAAESAADRVQLEQWVHELKDRAPNDPHLTPKAKAATRGIQAYFVELLEERRRHPRNDLVTGLVTSDIDGTPFADADLTPASEILGLMMVLFLGGVETTAGLTSTVFKLLAENPDQRALLLADPSLIPSAVEETVRMATPLQLSGRTTSREVTLHGVTIPKGGRVVLVYGAANRDERKFADPDRFDVRRERLRHLGFSEGMHGCLGAPLARLEVKVALEEALPLLGDYELAAPAVRYRSTPNMYVWSSLPLSFTPSGTPVDAPPETGVLSERATDLTVQARELEAEVTVEGKDLTADGVVTLRLRERSGRALPPWAPGAHVDLVLDGAPTRQYSLCGDPTDRREYRIGVLRDPDGSGGSLYVHDTLAVGQDVRIRGPRNHFRFLDSPRYLFIAGGIGITPLLPMIAAAEAAGHDWELVYGGRRRESMGFLDELAAYGDKVRAWPQDENGFLPLADLLGQPRADTLVYCCGPEPLLDAVEQACQAWPHGSLHLERFTPRTLTEPVRSDSFEVVLARSDLKLVVPPERSILDVVEEAGVGVLSSCAEGTCGTCETAVLEGVPDHRDSVLDEDAQKAGDCMMICISRSCTDRLVLDL
ncbi:MAG: ferredoxin [Marmoricola sp.]|jgi:cytochrome P450/ferredoxin-NADP reductase|nr:ferredoxin [Marmoricola sp.]